MVSRRFFIQGAALAGCSLTAHPLMSTASFAQAPGEGRLIVIILRGAMDGLDVVQPLGDPALRDLRKTLSGGEAAGAHDLDGFFAMHAALGPLLPLWQAGELAFTHATSTPYRDKRSHFDGQDLLEAGSGGDISALSRDGWLNRLLTHLPDARAETAYSVGADELRVLTGGAPSLSWAPEAKLRLSPQAATLLGRIYHDDPLFHAAAEEAIAISGGPVSEMMQPKGRAGADIALAQFAAEKLNGATRIAAFSLNGWDTHRGQPAMIGAALGRLSEVILSLKQGLGANWGRTTLLAMTEFGRTARENGTQGTDHGTGGAMVMAGGAIRGGRVYGRWPGLTDLYAGRDLMPTSDLRSWAAWSMRALYGVERNALETSVFPGLDLGDDPKFML